MFIFLSIFMSLMLLISATSMMSLNQKNITKIYNRTGNYDKVAKKMQNISTNDKKFTARYRTEYEEKKKNREAIETALIRACRSLNFLATASNCSGASKASVVWKFVGNTGNTGNLDPTWTGSKNSVFSCTTFSNGQYGRYLMQKAYPKQEIVGKGYRYDLTNVNDTHVDPCGYTDIVRK